MYLLIYTDGTCRMVADIQEAVDALAEGGVQAYYLLASQLELVPEDEEDEVQP